MYVDLQKTTRFHSSRCGGPRRDTAEDGGASAAEICFSLWCYCLVDSVKPLWGTPGFFVLWFTGFCCLGEPLLCFPVVWHNWICFVMFCPLGSSVVQFSSLGVEPYLHEHWDMLTRCCIVFDSWNPSTFRSNPVVVVGKESLERSFCLIWEIVLNSYSDITFLVISVHQAKRLWPTCKHLNLLWSLRFCCLVCQKSLQKRRWLSAQAFLPQSSSSLVCWFEYGSKIGYPKKHFVKWKVSKTR